MAVSAKMERGTEVKEVLRRIIEEMEKGGQKQKIIASKIGRKDSWFSQFKNGDIIFSLQTLFDIAKALGVTPASLLPGNFNDDKEKLSFEEYVRKICRDEISKGKEEPKTQ